MDLGLSTRQEDEPSDENEDDDEDWEGNPK